MSTKQKFDTIKVDLCTKVIAAQFNSETYKDNKFLVKNIDNVVYGYENENGDMVEENVWIVLNNNQSKIKDGEWLVSPEGDDTMFVVSDKFMQKVIENQKVKKTPLDMIKEAVAMLEKMPSTKPVKEKVKKDILLIVKETEKKIIENQVKQQHAKKPAFQKNEVKESFIAFGTELDIVLPRKITLAAEVV